MQKMAAIGPCQIDICKPSDFSNIAKEIKLEEVWRLCGPSAERNMAKLPLWQVIAMAYLEGLHHGNAIATEYKTSKVTS